MIIRCKEVRSTLTFTIILLIILTLFSRLIGMGREIILAYFYGATMISDAYLMSIAIPTILVTIFITSFATGFIPVYQKLDGDTAQKHEFTNKVFGLIIIICTIILILAFIFTPAIVSIFVPGFGAEATSLTVTFTRFTLLSVFFLGVNSLLHSFMQIKEKVLLASLSGLPFNIIAIIFIFLSFHFELYLIAIGSIFAIGAQTIYLLILARAQKLTFKPQFNIKHNDESLRNLAILTFPIILANAVEQIGLIVDKNIASTFETGAISALSYASRTTIAFSGIIITSFLVVTFPKIAKLTSQNNLTKMKNALAESIVGLSLFTIPVIAAIITFSVPVTYSLFGRGAFDEDAVAITSRLLFFNIFFLFGNGLMQLFSRVFFSLKDSKTPLIISTLTVLLNIILNFTLTPIMGIAGLTLATSLASFFGMSLLLLLLRKKIGSLRLKNTLHSVGKIIIASTAMALGAYFTYRYILLLSGIIALLIAATVGVIIYSVLLLVLRIREVDELIAFIVNKIRTRKSQ